MMHMNTMNMKKNVAINSCIKFSGRFFSTGYAEKIPRFGASVEARKESQKKIMQTSIAAPAAMTAATQNVEECLRSDTARLMFANSEFLVLLNQAATDRAELAKLLNISTNQMSYITSAEAGHGLIRVGGSIVPFANEFPRDTELYRLMTTTPGDR